MEAAPLLARGAAAERWSLAYLPGLPPPKAAPSTQRAAPAPSLERAATAPSLPPTTVAAALAAVAVAEAAVVVKAMSAESCPICLEKITRAVQLGCGHSLCAGCALRCGDAGHRRCPICRAPHLLHPERLAQRSLLWRRGYASWRIGGAAGARGELSSIRVPAAAEAARRAEAGGISCAAIEAQMEAEGIPGAGRTSVHGGVGHSRQCGDLHRASMSACTGHSAPDLVKLGGVEG